MILNDIIVQASFMIVINDRKNIFIIQATDLLTEVIYLGLGPCGDTLSTRTIETKAMQF